jgi:hypothetical protein
LLGATPSTVKGQALRDREKRITSEMVSTLRDLGGTGHSANQALEAAIKSGDQDRVAKIKALIAGIRAKATARIQALEAGETPTAPSNVFLQPQGAAGNTNPFVQHP